MTDFQFTPSTLRSWQTVTDADRTVHVTGWAVEGDRRYSGKLLAKRVLDADESPLHFSELLGKLDGNFAVVAGGPNRIVLATDPVRSIPLFYRQQGGTVAASDDARLLHGSKRTVDEHSLIELATAGYVTGSHTLFAEVSGLQSGELLTWTPDFSLIDRRRYYRYACDYDAEQPVEQLCSEFDQALTTVFMRLIDSLEGRQAVVPLSGGLDSRLVASMLKRCGYRNVFCVSYGIPNNEDTSRSREVAEALGYPWKHLPYSKALWEDALSSEEMREYWSFSSNGVSVPHCDDWPALRMLHDQKEVSDDAVFVPGHTGDFISGGHLKAIFDPVHNDNPSDFNGAMVTKHYSLWDDLVASSNIRDVIDQRLAEVVDEFPRDTDEDMARMYEYWEWQERQAKLIINSVRSYEFFGSSWRIPLWAREIMDFWRKVPLALKMDKYLYRCYLVSHDPTGVFEGEAPSALWTREKAQAKRYRTVRGQARALSSRFGPTAAVVRRYDKLRRHMQEYRHHPLGMAKVYGGLRYLLNDSSKRNSLSLLSRDFLRSEYSLEIGDLVSKTKKSTPELEGSKVPSVRS